MTSSGVGQLGLPLREEKQPGSSVSGGGRGAGEHAIAVAAVATRAASCASWAWWGIDDRDTCMGLGEMGSVSNRGFHPPLVPATLRSPP